MVEASQDTDKSDKKIEVVIKREMAPDYKSIYATGAEGGNYGPYDLRIKFYDLDIDLDEQPDKITQIQTHIFKGSVVLSYAAAKQLSEWLIRHLERYEAESGRPIYTGDVSNQDQIEETHS